MVLRMLVLIFNIETLFLYGNDISEEKKVVVVVDLILLPYRQR